MGVESGGSVTQTAQARQTAGYSEAFTRGAIADKTIVAKTREAHTTTATAIATARVPVQTNIVQTVAARSTK